MNSNRHFAKVKALLVSVMLIATLIPAGLPAEAKAKPTITIGTSRANGTGISLALTSSYKNKTIKIQVGTLVKKKVVFSTVASVTTGTTGLATFCNPGQISSTQQVRVLFGKKVVVLAKGSKRGVADVCALAAPTSLELLGTSDSGIDTHDGVTNVTTLAYTGVGIAGASLQMYVDGVANGSPCTVAQDRSFACNVSGIATEGTHQITAKQSVGTQVSATSAPVPVVIDRTAPVATLVWVGARFHSTGTVTMNVTASEPVFGLDAADFAAPNDSAFSHITFSNLQSTNTGYTIDVVSNSFDGPDLTARVITGGFTDRAGNQSGESSSAVLPFAGTPPRIVSASAENSGTYPRSSKITFTFDQVVSGVTISDLYIIRYETDCYFEPDPSTRQSQNLSRYAVDQVYTTDHQTYWFFLEVGYADEMNDPMGSRKYYKVGAGISSIAGTRGATISIETEVKIGTWEHTVGAYDSDYCA